MKIAVVTDIHVGKPLEHNGKVRASSHLVESKLTDYLQGIITEHRPDAVVNLGDLIRSEGREADIVKYGRLISGFKSINCPVIHLLGNHELKKMHADDAENIWQDNGFAQKSFGYKVIGTIALIWLGLELDPYNHRIRSLPSEQLHSLSDLLKRIDQPAIIFTHCAIDDHDVNGNFFYEATDNRDKSALFLKNSEEIREVLAASGRVAAVLQAHLHYFHVKEIDGIPYVTCPAMGDNICGPDAVAHVPGIYTILSCIGDRVTVKSFSGKYCFAGYEKTMNLSR